MRLRALSLSSGPTSRERVLPDGRLDPDARGRPDDAVPAADDLEDLVDRPDTLELILDCFDILVAEDREDRTDESSGLLLEAIDLEAVDLDDMEEFELSNDAVVRVPRLDESVVLLVPLLLLSLDDGPCL